MESHYSGDSYILQQNLYFSESWSGLCASKFCDGYLPITLALLRWFFLHNCYTIDLPIIGDNGSQGMNRLGATAPALKGIHYVFQSVVNIMGL